MKALISEIQNKLNELLNKQLSCCKQLLELSKSQKKAIQSDELETITKILSEKEKLIEEFINIKELYEQECNRLRIAPAPLPPHAGVGGVGGGLRIEKENSIRNPKSEIQNEIDAVLEELRVEEEECEKTFSRRCAEIKEEIDQTKRSKAILNRFSFRTKIPQSSKLIDKEA